MDSGGVVDQVHLTGKVTTVTTILDIISGHAIAIEVYVHRITHKFAEGDDPMKEVKEILRPTMAMDSARPKKRKRGNAPAADDAVGKGNDGRDEDDAVVLGGANASASSSWAKDAATAQPEEAGGMRQRA